MIKWYGFSETYLNVQDVGRRDANPENLPTHVGRRVKTARLRINSVLFLGTKEIPGWGVLENHVREYWFIYFGHFARKQLGTHFFIDRCGNLNMVQTGIISLNDNEYDRRFPTQHAYAVTTEGKITGIYPVLRNHIYPVRNIIPHLALPANTFAVPMPPDQEQRYSYELAVGLSFRWFFDHLDEGEYNRGNRYYTRFNLDQWTGIRAGHVFDITEVGPNPLNGLRQIVDEYDRCAFYVCAGAKLIVVDDY